MRRSDAVIAGATAREMGGAAKKRRDNDEMIGSGYHVKSTLSPKTLLKKLALVRVS